MLHSARLLRTDEVDYVECGTDRICEAEVETSRFPSNYSGTMLDTVAGKYVDAACKSRTLPGDEVSQFVADNPGTAEIQAHQAQEGHRRGARS